MNLPLILNKDNPLADANCMAARTRIACVEVEI